MNYVRLFVLALVSVSFAVSVIADEFKSVDAKLAKARFAKEKKTLDDAYASELKSISKTYIAALTAARKVALETNDLDEAQSIVLEISEVENSIKSAEPVAPVVPSTPMPPQTKLTVKDIAGHKFWFYCTSFDKRLMTFNKDGRFESDPQFEDKNRYYTVNSNGQLCFTNKDKQPYAIYEPARQSKQGLSMSTAQMSGTFKFFFLFEQK